VSERKKADVQVEYLVHRLDGLSKEEIEAF
jgi:hypothetical protein